MNGNTPNVDDLRQAMARADEGDDSVTSPSGTSSATKKAAGSNTILDNTKQVLVKWGIPAAVVAAVVALAIYLVRTEINAGLVRSLKAKGASAVIGVEIRNRVHAHANGYRVLGLVANLTKDPAAIAAPIGGALFANLQPPTPTTDKQGFLDALAVYIESQTVATGLDDVILTMVVEGKDNDAIDQAILKQMKTSLKEQDLKRIVAAILIALTADVAAPDDKTRIPTIKSAVDQVDLTRLLTAPNDDDFTPTQTDIDEANAAGVVKGQPPFKGVAALIKVELGKL